MARELTAKWVEVPGMAPASEGPTLASDWAPKLLSPEGAPVNTGNQRASTDRAA